MQAAITGTKFLSAYRDSLAEDIAVVMLWAGRDVAATDSEEVSFSLDVGDDYVPERFDVGNAEGAQALQGNRQHRLRDR